MMSTATARKLVKIAALLTLELLLMAIFPGWLGVCLAWSVTIAVGVRVWRAEHPRRPKRVGPPLEWID